jgi:tripartite ATP-independent transporter DctM subunit
MTTATCSLLLAVLLLGGFPVAFSLAISGALGLLWLGGPATLLGVLKTAPFSAVSSYEIITIPMFLVMAEFVVLSGFADELFAAASTWLGRVRGGLAMATALAGAGFGAISGSSTAAAATLSATTVPAMLRRGYDPALAGGVVAISGTLAMLIPPSIALVIYGIIADVSIGSLLIGGVVPGILVTLTILLTVAFLVWRNPSLAPLGGSFSLKEKLRSLRTAGPLVLLFMMVTGTIYTGVATPTEASALGAFGAAALAAYAGKLRGPGLLHALTRAAHTTAMILLIMLGAQIFGYFFTLTRTTQELVQLVGSLEVSRWVIMALIIFGYLILGCFMDQIAILILTVPVVLPVIKTLGFDPVWFGVIVVVTAEVGMVTPPLGLNVFVVSRCTNRPLGEVFAGVTPHVLAHILIIAVLVAFPVLTLWLPSTMSH